MAVIESTRLATHRPEKTCDIGIGIVSAFSGKSIEIATVSSPPSRVPGRTKGPSSFAPDARWCRGGAPRLARLLEGGKRRSWGLSDRQVANVLDAAEWSVLLAVPLNRFVTINWEAAGVADCTRATGHFLKSVGDWLRRRGRQIAYVWVQESGPRVGQHVHMLIHVPADLVRRFSELQRGWLKACGATYRKGLIKSRPVGRTYCIATSSPPSGYRENLRRVLDYMLKQRSSSCASACDRPPPCRSLVMGKRCATSENIGARARARGSSRQL